MGEYLLIHYRPNATQDTTQLYWALGGGQHPSITLGHGDLSELKPVARGKKVYLLLDARHTTIDSVIFPSANRAKQLLAAPFALEEQLADDIYDTHFALGKAESGNKVPVIAIKRSLLEQTLLLFKQYAIQVDVVCADNVALAASPQQWTVLVDDQSALIKSGLTQAHSCDRNNLPLILEALLAQSRNDAANSDEQATEKSNTANALTSPDSIIYYHKASDIEAETLLSSLEVQVQRKSYQNHPLEIFVQQLEALNSLNLLQGEFTPKRESNTWLQPWKSVAVIAGMWLVLELTHASIVASQLEQKNYQLSRNIESEFKRAMPGTKKMNNLRKRIERRLNELRTGGSQGQSSGFLQILSKTSAILVKNENLEIKAAVYRNKYIDIDLSAKTLQDIEQAKTQLDKLADIKTTLSTTVEKSGVQGRLRLESQLSQAK